MRKGVFQVDIIRTIAQIGIIILFYLVGEYIVSITGIIIPGSIVGLVLLWLSLYFKLLNVKFIQKGASFMLAFLTLFFIPSTVAVINYPELLTVSGGLLILAVIISTILALVITGKVSRIIEEKEKQKKEGEHVTASSTKSIYHK